MMLSEARLEATFGSLFTGIGGLDLGLERAGWMPKWQVEIDDYCNEILTRWWPHVHRERDVRECGAENLCAVDLMCGGFPCQDISFAGHGAGLAGAHSGLWRDFSRLIRALRPRYIVVENVPALLGRGMGTVLGDLAESGYDAEWACIPASALGAPQVRERLFIVAYAAGLRCQARFFTYQQSVAALRSAADQGQWLWQRGRVDGAPLRPVPHSSVCRMADGIPDRLDRYRVLGNAVVPAVAEWVGRRILEWGSDLTHPN